MRRRTIRDHPGGSAPPRRPGPLADRVRSALGWWLHPPSRYWLALAILTYVGVSLSLSVLRLLNFYASNWDLGIFQQALWTGGHGQLFYESGDFEFTKIQSFFQAHPAFILYGLLPLYSWFPSPVTLLAVQSVAVGLAAVPLYLITLHLTASGRKGLLASVMFLAWAPLLAANLFDFHLESFLPIELFSLFYLLLKRHYVAALLVSALPALTIEAGPVLVFFIGLFFAVPSWAFLTQVARDLRTPSRPSARLTAFVRRFARNLRTWAVQSEVIVGLTLMATSVGLYLLIRLIQGDLILLWLPAGSGLPPHLAGVSLSRLGLTWAGLSTGFFGKLSYWILVYALLAFVPFRAPKTILLVLPWWVFTMFSGNVAFAKPGFQYGFIVAGPVFIGLAYGLARVSLSGTSAPAPSILGTVSSGPTIARTPISVASLAAVAGGLPVPDGASNPHRASPDASRGQPGGDWVDPSPASTEGLTSPAKPDPWTEDWPPPSARAPRAPAEGGGNLTSPIRAQPEFASPSGPRGRSRWRRLESLRTNPWLIVIGIALVANIALSPVDPLVQNTHGLGVGYQVAYSFGTGAAEVLQVASLIPAAATVLASDNLFPFVANHNAAYTLTSTTVIPPHLPFNATSFPGFVLISQAQLPAVPYWLPYYLYNSAFYGLRADVGHTSVGPVLLFQYGYSGPALDLLPLSFTSTVYHGRELNVGAAGVIVSDSSASFGTAIRSVPGINHAIWYGPYASLPRGNYSVQVVVHAWVPQGSANPPSKQAVLEVLSSAFGHQPFFDRTYTLPQLSGGNWTYLSFSIVAPEPLLQVQVVGIPTDFRANVVIELNYLVIAQA